MSRKFQPLPHIVVGASCSWQIRLNTLATRIPSKYVNCIDDLCHWPANELQCIWFRPFIFCVWLDGKSHPNTYAPISLWIYFFIILSSFRYNYRGYLPITWIKVWHFKIQMSSVKNKYGGHKLKRDFREWKGLLRFN